jgi:hypothetical protein
VQVPLQQIRPVTKTHSVAVRAAVTVEVLVPLRRTQPATKTLLVVVQLVVVPVQVQVLA